MRKSITKRLKMKKSGKVLYRPMAQGHFRSKRSGTEARRKRGERSLVGARRILVKHLELG
jgi:ribosomal protein L35